MGGVNLSKDRRRGGYGVFGKPALWVSRRKSFEQPEKRDRGANRLKKNYEVERTKTAEEHLTYGKSSFKD